MAQSQSFKVSLPLESQITKKPSFHTPTKCHRYFWSLVLSNNAVNIRMPSAKTAFYLFKNIRGVLLVWLFEYFWKLSNIFSKFFELRLTIFESLLVKTSFLVFLFCNSFQFIKKFELALRSSEPVIHLLLNIVIKKKFSI